MPKRVGSWINRWKRKPVLHCANYTYIYINGFLNVPRTTLQSRQKLLKLLVDCFVDVTLSLRGTNIDRVLIQKTLHFNALCSNVVTAENKIFRNTNVFILLSGVNENHYWDVLLPETNLKRVWIAPPLIKQTDSATGVSSKACSIYAQLVKGRPNNTIQFLTAIQQFRLNKTYVSSYV